MKLSDTFQQQINTAIFAAVSSGMSAGAAAAWMIGYLARRMAGLSGRKKTADALRRLALEIERA